jgi:hypothetical protein
MQLRKLALFLLVGAAAMGTLAIAGCGGGGGSDEDDVKDTITTAFTSNDPEVCDLITQSLTEELSGETGDKAVETCREQAQQGEPSDSVEFSDVSVDGDTASATFDVSGGGSPGHIEAQLVKEDGDWKIDKVSASASK